MRYVRRSRSPFPFTVMMAILAVLPALSQPEPPVPRRNLGDPKTLAGWTGVTPGPGSEGGGTTLAVPGEAAFRLPNGPGGWIKHGFRTWHDESENWQRAYGVQFEIRIPDDHPVELSVTLLKPDATDPKQGVKTDVTIRGAGWHTVTLPWTVFAFEQAYTAFLKNVKELRIQVRGRSSAASSVLLRNPAVVGGAILALHSAARGKSAPAGGTVEYAVEIGNATTVPQAVSLSLERYGWESMEAAVEPARLELAPGETKTVAVRVQVPARIPPGGHEKQILQAVANGDGSAAAKLTFITARELPHPNILHTQERWDEVRAKVKNHEWARQAQEEIVAQADRWKVPEIATPPNNDPGDTYGPYLFATANEQDLMACGVAWQLTGNKQYSEKIALFLRRLSDPGRGYPATLRACNQSLVQEGHFFQHIAMAYDMALDSGAFTPEDIAQIERTFRIYIETIERTSDNGAINNWNLSEACGAFYCALAMQDLVTADRFISGPAGIKDQLAKGTMDDGWWYECSISYNVWCASEFSQAAIAYQPWGFNFRDLHVPASYAREALLSSPDNAAELSGGARPDTGSTDLNSLRRPFGMNKELWGPIQRPWREIRDLWNSLLPFIDYRGVMFGVNDSTENLVAGHRTEIGAQPFEIAFYLFRDPAYAVLIKLAKKRDLLYGVPELPAETPSSASLSAYADNVGLALLRSQTQGRPQREQIQAALHYGTHGWAHGHFDRTNLLCLMRYGRSFYNPEMVWYGYEPFMYKFYVQTSVSHNMVVVDQKMQEAVESDRLLFYSGKAMQAAVVQTNARWSNPPYGGMVYDYVPVKTFEEKTWREGRHVPIPKHPPAYGSLTGFTENILQRRLLVVTDDYVVLADYVRGDQPHTYESLYQIKGFLGLEAPEKKFLRHDAQWNPDPVGSAQFVTDCAWYTANSPAKSQFQMSWGQGADNEGTRTLYNEYGVLRMDLYSVWPKKQAIMIGTAPEFHNVEKRLFYTVRGGNRILAQGKFGAWILGRADIDVPVDGLDLLELETSVELSKKPTVFWANARIVTADGSEIPLSKLKTSLTNIEEPPMTGLDYFGGPIKIAGEAFAEGTPGQPKDPAKSGLVQVDLRGVGAVRFKATLGGDYPLGNEAARRKTYAIRAPRSESARFLSVIEPFENKAVVKSAEAVGPDSLRVTLADGRIQEIAISNFEGDGGDIEVTLVETKEGAVLRRETTRQR